MKKVITFLVSAMCVLLMFTGCPVAPEEDPTEDESVFSLMSPSSDLDGDGTANSEDNDIDGDGLSNYDETNVWHTNLYSADTDGDGWNDYLETNDGYYDQATNSFNPCVADVPKLQIQISGDPDISLVYETSSGSKDSKSLETTTENTTGTTTSSEVSNTT